MPEEENCLQLEHWDIFCPGSRQCYLMVAKSLQKLLDK